jgi:hypothetical protein
LHEDHAKRISSPTDMGNQRLVRHFGTAAVVTMVSAATNAAIGMTRKPEKSMPSSYDRY